jgi:methionyl-tRNA formyltransferase
VYFDHLFPLGVTALLEAADLVSGPAARETPQDETQASYEGWCRAAEAKIAWHAPADHIYNLIRGCNPAPGAWTTVDGRKLSIFEARKHPTRTQAEVKGRPGQCIAVGSDSIRISAQGGQIEIFTVRAEDGKKVPAPQYCAESGLQAGFVLGT